MIHSFILYTGVCTGQIGMNVGDAIILVVGAAPIGLAVVGRKTPFLLQVIAFNISTSRAPSNLIRPEMRGGKWAMLGMGERDDQSECGIEWHDDTSKDNEDRSNPHHKQDDSIIPTIAPNYCPFAVLLCHISSPRTQCIFALQFSMPPCSWRRNPDIKYPAAAARIVSQKAGHLTSSIASFSN